VAAYIVFHNRILDEEAMQTYIPKAVDTMAPYGAELLVLAEQSDVLEGPVDHPRTIILKFDSRERAQAWYDCPEYRGVLPIRLGATEGSAVLVDGM
jgi:uncharacterized protein (DUF1330 family)